MNSNEFIQLYLAVNNSITRTSASNTRGENQRTLETTTSDHIMFWGVAGFVICWAAIFFMLSKRVRVTRKEVAITIQPSHQIPCKNCKFYSNDPHLKCAVNPSVVLTEQAVDCADYSSKEKDRRS